MKNPKVAPWTVVAVIAVAAAAISAMVLVAMLFQPPQEVHFYSFEEDIEEWAARGIDLEHGEGTLDWSIDRSQEMAREGNTSLRFYLENWNDAGKIWIERGFEVEPDRTFAVTIRCAFASADFGSVNLWRIIAGALSERPETRNDLEPVFQDHTGNAMETDSGFIWLDKTYDSSVTVGSDGMLWVAIGVWGTWETPRTYFLDGVHITIRSS